MKEYKLTINGNDYNVVINDVEGTTANVEVNGTPFTVEFEKPISAPKKQAVKVVKPQSGSSLTTSSRSVQHSPTPAPSAGATITSPLPGIILEINVKEGDVVKKNQKLMMLEAMKMENNIESTVDGTVKSIKVSKGDSVLEGAPLIVIG